jgi:hypothetical protein
MLALINPTSPMVMIGLVPTVFTRKLLRRTARIVPSALIVNVNPAVLSDTLVSLARIGRLELGKTLNNPLAMYVRQQMKNSMVGFVRRVP